MKAILFLIFLWLPDFLMAAVDDSLINIIPRPVYIKSAPGFFKLNEATKLVASSKQAQENASLLNEFLLRNYGFKLKIATTTSSQKNVILFTDAAPSVLKEGAYDLEVNTTAIKITGQRDGLFYGLQSLFQLIPDSKNLLIPSCTIHDYPRFQWRGMHLDVSRHFFPKEFIKKYIDYLSYYKLNVFHWHLTDDQGWRIEILKYPLLTRVGAWRSGTMVGPYKNQQFDSIPYGGFYTQEDIREIVAYAAARHVSIVPEIEMPGHCMAALAAYPQFSCTGGPFEVGRGWGGYPDIFIPTEETFDFLKNILEEVCSLFPGKYIHIGGDEVDKKPWKENTFCQQLISKLNLVNEEGLQSYFIRRIDSFLISKNKLLVGWDEILQGGLSPNAVVMSWQGTKGGIMAAKQKHRAVMSPQNPCYFDHYQSTNPGEPLAFGGFNSIEMVYAYDPVPSELDSAAASFILGAQANLWTEYIATTSQAEYMLFPRITALAEICWTPLTQKSFVDFIRRLQQHFSYYNNQGIYYSKALYDVKLNCFPAAENKGILITLSTVDKNAEIRYAKGNDTLIYTDTILLNENTTISAMAYLNGESFSRPLYLAFHFSKSTAKKVSIDPPPSSRYNYGGAFTLVNAQLGPLPWRGTDWLGWTVEKVQAVIDLGNSQEFSSVSVDVLDAKSSWIHLPVEISVFVSNNSQDFIHVKSVNADFIQRSERMVKIDFEKMKYQFVKVVVSNAIEIPEGNPGAGKAPWIFIDEIMVE